MIYGKLLTILISLTLATSLAYASPAVKIKQPIHTGVVTDLINSKDATFMQIADEGDEYWVIIRKSNVRVGAKVSFQERKWVKNFTSRELNRNFEMMLFASDFKTLPSDIAATVTETSGS